MISSTVTCSKSKIEVSMLWWRAGNSAPDSFTTVFSSSLLKLCSSICAVVIPNKRNMPLVIQFTITTNGKRIFNRPLSTIELGKATFSGYSAASVFGVTSAKIKTTSVSAPVAIAIPRSPYKRIPIIVATCAAAIFTRLLPIKIRPMSLSGRLNSLLTRFAAR